MTKHEKEMRELEKQILVQDCIKLRLKTRSWLTLEQGMLHTMITMANSMQNHEHFPQELKPANQKTLVELERELALRN